MKWFFDNLYFSASFLGTPVKDAVITVPAYFNDSQRQVTSFMVEFCNAQHAFFEEI